MSMKVFGLLKIFEQRFQDRCGDSQLEPITSRVADVEKIHRLVTCYIEFLNVAG
jgi:hypothetical protein